METNERQGYLMDHATPSHEVSWVFKLLHVITVWHFTPELLTPNRYTGQGHHCVISDYSDLKTDFFFALSWHSLDYKWCVMIKIREGPSRNPDLSTKGSQNLSDWSRHGADFRRRMLVLERGGSHLSLHTPERSHIFKVSFNSCNYFCRWIHYRTLQNL